ncbi:uncharacterized protein DDB_G0271670-like isoform X2 [Daphnia pulicaria]|uniref:uncharacterized protein DDB_G0271670-like isoform X2 n=1 Tax=Daphnia pulicaria TaxID=35523 RepID=UPI001EEB7A31|nr:uncharacterized protein DDB_G0271670-like isoform X2 [Daphnia pulicaria]
MRVVTSLELGGPRILQEFWMAVLKVLSRNKESNNKNNQEQQQLCKSRTNNRLMKKSTGSKKIRRSIPIPVTGEGTKKPLDLTPQSVATAKAAVAAAAQRAERNLSVRRDLALDLPTCPTLPDGEEKPYGSSTRLRIRDHDQESEIYRECIRPPPNRTVHETSTSFPPFRCNSESILTGHLPTSDGSGRVGHSKTAGPSSSSSSTITTNNSQSSSSSSSSSIMAVYCCTSASYSSSTSSLSSNSYGSSGGGGGGYGYRNLRQPLKQQHQPLLQQQQERENGSDGKDLFSSAPPPLSGTRLLLDIHGQPIVTRSKSMSTGSSLQQQDAPCSSSSSSSSGNLLSVMVPFPPPMPQQQQQQLTIPAATSCASKTLESAVKSCVRSFRDRVHPSGKSSAPAAPAISCLVPPVGGAVGGVDNAGYVESSAGGGGGSASASGCSSRWPSATTTLPEQQQQQHNNNNNNNSHATEESSSSSSRSKLANLPVVPCASAASTSPSQTRRDL